jgi:hypothetical protein
MNYPRISVRFLLAGLMTAACLPGQVAPQLYLRLGLYDGAHTGTGAIDGLVTGTVSFSTTTGFVLGTASAYGFGVSPYPQSVWLADLNGGAVNRVGFTSAEHTRNDGFQTSAATFLDKSGWAAGTSARYNGGATALGQNVWLAHAATGTSVAVGLTGAGYVRADGMQSNTPFVMQDRYLLGVANRYSGSTGLGNAVWAAPFSAPGTTFRIGLFDAEHTRNTGAQTTLTLWGAPGLDYAAGTTARYNGGTTQLGQSAWVASTLTGVTTRVGFFDAAYTFSGGQQSTSLVAAGAGGWIGISASNLTPGGFGMINGTERRTSAWYYSNSTGVTRELGFTGPDYLLDGGGRLSEVFAVSDLGYVAGLSRRNNAGLHGVDEHWVVNLANDSYQFPGLHDAEHREGDADLTQFGVGTRPNATNPGTDAMRDNTTYRFTASGYLLGETWQWNSFNLQSGVTYTQSIDFGASPWVFNPATGTTTRLGLIDAEHTRANNVRESVVINAFAAAGLPSISEQGFVAGRSTRYQGGITKLGNSAWVASAATGITHRVGLFDAGHTSASSVQESAITYFTSAGYAAGSSRKYDGATQTGQSAWIATAVTGATLRVGLYDGVHTSVGGGGNPTGMQYATAKQVTDTGFARGTSIRFGSGGTGVGYSAWVADFGTGLTTRVGLFDATHTTTSGIQYSDVTGLTDAGLAWGYSTRYQNETTKGQTAWIYDLVSSSQTIFELSVRASDGYAFSQIDAVNAQGLALGRYTYFDGAGTDLGLRPFVWSAELGVVDIFDSVTGQTLSNEWASLAAGSSLFDSGWILGTGLPIDARAGSVGNYAVNYSAVPEPATVAISLGLAALAGTVLLRRVRRNRR